MSAARRRVRARAGRRAAAGALLAFAALAACGPGAEVEPPAPVTPQATVVIEPPTLEVGRVATVRVAVATPPGHHVVPLASPGEVPGVWLLDWRTLPVVQGPGRWLHETRIRVRGREPGRHVWPSLRVEVEGPEGERRTLETEPVPFEVGSSAAAAGRDSPFPLRDLPATHGWGALALAALAGALVTLAGVGAFVLARRLAPRGADVPAGAAPAPGAGGRAAAWREAERQLADVRAMAAENPHAAAERAAEVLRTYVSRRFHLGIESRTTEELAAARPPRALATRWRALVEILEALDAVRFRSEAAVRAHGAHLQPALERALDDAARLVRDTRPQEAPRP